MKIAVFTDSFLPGRGGTEIAVYNMCRALSRIEGNEVKVYCPQFHPADKVTPFEFPVFRVPSIALNKSDMMALPSLFRHVYRDVEDFRPDVIHFCSVSGMAKVALKVGERLGVPVISTVHTNFRQAFSDDIPVKFVVDGLMKKLARRVNASDMVSLVSRTQINDLVEAGVDRYDFNIIPNGANVRSISVSEREIDAVREKFNIRAGRVLLSVGRLTKFKNVQFSLKALAAAKQHGLCDFQFVIVGTGKHENMLRMLTKLLKLEDNVIFTGFVNDKELAAFYELADLMLFPSIADTYGLVVDDAARAGVPAMVLEHTAPAERIDNNYNGFVCSHDSALFGDRIISILNNRENLNRVKSNLYTLKPSTWAEIAENYQFLYREAVKLKSPKLFAYRQPKMRKI